MIKSGIYTEDEPIRFSGGFHVDYNRIQMGEMELGKIGKWWEGQVFWGNQV